MRKLPLFLILLAFEIPPLAAQTTRNVVVTATVPAILSLNTSSSSIAVTLADSDYNAAGVASKSMAAAHNLQVRSNRTWQVAFRSTTAAFSFTPSAGDADPVKPCGHLAVRTGATAFAPVTTNNQTLKTGNPGSTQTPGNTFDVDYSLASNLSVDKPGSYSLTVTYTVTTP